MSAYTKPRAIPIVDCPRCGEGDDRSIGMNRCGLCEYEFFVTREGVVFVDRAARQRSR